MESKWLKENQKKNKKFQRNRIIGLSFAGIMLGLMVVFHIFSIISAPEEQRTIAIRGSIFSMILLIGVIAFSSVIIMKKLKKEKSYPDLKQELHKALSDPEDLKLLDNEVYGNLRREVKLGTDNFTFTPHFLIQNIDFTKYMVVKVQRVAYVKICERENFGDVEFFDKAENSLGKVTLVLYKCRSLYNVCQEQIPWAEFQ